MNGRQARVVRGREVGGERGKGGGRRSRGWVIVSEIETHEVADGFVVA